MNQHERRIRAGSGDHNISIQFALWYLNFCYLRLLPFLLFSFSSVLYITNCFAFLPSNVYHSIDCLPYHRYPFKPCFIFRACGLTFLCYTTETTWFAEIIPLQKSGETVKIRLTLRCKPVVDRWKIFLKPHLIERLPLLKRLLAHSNDVNRV